MDPHNINKATIGAFRSALYDFDRGRLTSVVKDVFDPGCAVHLANPFEDLDGPGALLDQAFFPLAEAIPDLECRDTIVIAGSAVDQVDQVDQDWIRLKILLKINHIGFLTTRIQQSSQCYRNLHGGDAPGAPIFE